MTLNMYCETIAFSKRKHKNQVDNLNILESRLQKLTESSSSSPDEVETLEKEIQQIYNARAIGAQIRSRVTLIEENEKCSKYFVNLEKSRQSKKVLSSLKVDGETIHNNEEILMEEVNFYRKLYTTENVDSSSITTFLSNINDITKLNVNNANLCGGTLSKEECKCAIKEMNKNKSPGHDGLTAEFYHFFWSKISKLLIYSLNEGYFKGQLSHTQKHSVLSLLYKKGDPEDIENWRPISLLNTDYKMVAKVLAKRLQKALPLIISSDQQGFIQNRYIGLISVKFKTSLTIQTNST